ncbi:MAG: leucine-rich repeat domain-containing protein [Lachnospiraceae bacterium]|nr:leucine-rich repeat domain-containing protein [Lachnospiraceae bacterium]
MKKWKHIAAFAICMAAALTMTMSADAKTKKAQPSGKVCSGVKWTYNKKSKTLTIKGKGYAKISGFYSKKINGYAWPESEDTVLPAFTKIKFDEGITQIDQRYFTIEGVKQISLPKSLKKIKYQNVYRMNGAYEDWSTTLKSITVNKKNRRFSSSKGVLYSKDKKTIYAYPSGKSVKSYTLPSKVTEIAPYAFYAADIESLKLSSKLTVIRENAFEQATLKTVTGGDKLRMIERYAFYQADGLTSFAFGNSLKKIGYSAFAECNLQSITLPEKLSSLGDAVFRDNEELKSITILCKLDIGSVFSGCSSEYDYGTGNYQYRPITVILGKAATGPISTLTDELGKCITFVVDSANPVYYVKDGNLYMKKGNKLCYTKKTTTTSNTK